MNLILNVHDCNFQQEKATYPFIFINIIKKQEVRMKKTIPGILLSIVFVLQLQAQEGMWLLSQINQLDLNSKGLQITTKDVYSSDKPSISDAIVQLGGGTASFVSKDGCSLQIIMSLLLPFRELRVSAAII